MKVRLVTCLSLAIALVAVLGSRASAGQPSQQALNEMGLGGLSVMCDNDALAVRGFGYHGSKSTAKAWGKSWAQVSTRGASAGTENAYNAEGKHSASGKNLSYAGVLVIQSGGHGGHNGGGGGGPTVADSGDRGGHGGGGVKVKAVVVFAGGSSSAKNH